MSYIDSGAPCDENLLSCLDYLDKEFRKFNIGVNYRTATGFKPRIVSTIRGIPNSISTLIRAAMAKGIVVTLADFTTIIAEIGITRSRDSTLEDTVSRAEYIFIHNASSSYKHVAKVANFVQSKPLVSYQ